MISAPGSGVSFSVYESLAKTVRLRVPADSAASFVRTTASVVTDAAGRVSDGSASDVPAADAAPAVRVSDDAAPAVRPPAGRTAPDVEAMAGTLPIRLSPQAAASAAALIFLNPFVLTAFSGPLTAHDFGFIYSSLS